MNIVFDIGGTKSCIGVSENGETIDESVTYKTPQKYEEGITTFTETVKNLAKEQSIDIPIITASGLPGNNAKMAQIGVYAICGKEDVISGRTDFLIEDILTTKT